MPAIKLYAILALTFALTLQSAHATTAVVFSESTGRWGVTWNEPNKQEAIEVATERCRLLGGGKDCKPVRVTDERGFGAVANTCAGNYCGISVITGRRSAAQAERDAIKDCNSYYGTKNCYVLDNWEETGAAPVVKAIPPTPAPQPKPAAPTAKPAEAPVAKAPPSQPVQQPKAFSSIRPGEMMSERPLTDKELDEHIKKCASGDTLSCQHAVLDHILFRKDVVEGKLILASHNRKLCHEAKKAEKSKRAACDILDMIFELTFQENIPTASDFFEKACMQGHTPGCFRLGLLYDSGKGVRQDYRKAAQYYQMACDNKYKHNGACLHLAEIHSNPESGLYDRNKAVRYYETRCKETSDKVHGKYVCAKFKSLRETR